MRKQYIDNLRCSIVLLLFPFHVFMIYNNWGENFYIKQDGLFLPSLFNCLIWPWFMPSLFVIAGISAFYSLQSRGPGKFAVERIKKLFIPLFSGILLVVPVQTYYAEKFHNGYQGNYFYQYKLFFTKIHDLTGYSGGFTPGHLWFILYLFIISMAALPLVEIVKKLRFKTGTAIPFAVIVLSGILPVFGKPFLNTGGKSIVEYLIYYLLGYYILSNDNVIDKIVKHLAVLCGSCFIFMICYIMFYEKKFYAVNEIVYFIVYQLYSWTFILSVTGIYKYKVNFRNNLTDYFSKSSFAVYLFHQSSIVCCAYYIVQIPCTALLHIILILAAAIVLTFGMYEITKRIKFFRTVFAVRK
ncbi:MAG: acyltransferase family protein [Treponema sp.]|nr:acyltransferase family protein [Treponema sp.]